MKDHLQVIREHLQKHYPTLPPLSDGLISFWVIFTSDGLGRTLRQVLDHNQREILYKSGIEVLHYTPEKWGFDVYLGLIPGIYGKIYIRLAEAAYKLFYKHRLFRFHTDLTLESEIPVRDFLGNFHRGIRMSCCMASDADSNPILTATEIRFVHQWDLTHPAIGFRPILRASGQRLTNLEDELIHLAFDGFLENELGLDAELLPILKGHLDGLSNSEIACATSCPKTTVHYYNTKILKAIHINFSTDFESVKEFVKYWKLQTLPQKEG